MLSRRQFLQAAGIAIATAHLPHLPSSVSAAPGFETFYGRALQAAPVYATANANSLPLKHLWSDTVTPILETHGSWYRLPDGYTPRSMLQPMIKPASRTEAAADAPFWGEVSGAVAIVRQWCAADAPLVTRIGHGGVMHISDKLTLDGSDWYGIAENESGALLGWAQAANWSPLTEDATLPSLTLAVDPQTQQMDVYEGEQQILSAPVSIWHDLPAGRHTINEVQMAARSGEHYGAAWALAFGDNLRMTSAYWHNHFGITGGDTPFAALEVTPALARWLYPRVAEVIIL